MTRIQGKIWNVELSYANVLNKSNRKKISAYRSKSTHRVWITGVSCDIDWDKIADWVRRNTASTKYMSQNIYFVVKYRGFNLFFLSKNQSFLSFREILIHDIDNELHAELYFFTETNLHSSLKGKTQDYPSGTFHVFIHGYVDYSQQCKLAKKKCQSTMLQKQSCSAKKTIDSRYFTQSLDFEKINYYGVTCFRKSSEPYVYSGDGELLGVFNPKHGTLGAPCDPV